MEFRELGQGLCVSAIGMGCMGLTESTYGPVDETESARALDRAIDLGVTLLDTGETYGRDHSNEKLVGRVVERRRGDVLLATKFGLTFDIDSGSMVVDGRPETIRASCEGSLRRLRTDHIDVYFQHRVDPRVPIEDVWGELSLLVAEGKVRYLGLSEPGMQTLRKAHAIHPVAVVENEYSLFTRDPEAEVLPTLDELGIGLLCFAPLGRGMLSGRIRSTEDFSEHDFRRRLPRYQGENFARNLELVDAVAEIAGARGLSSAQLALAWLLSRGPRVIPIPSMETRGRVEENLLAADVTLTDAELAAIEAALPHGGIGERYGVYSGLSSAESSSVC
ncbi:aldo/keto reductase [Pseudonocardia xishanensis]|uniref:Aldo/keto reductase n=1 Tax=Pseudonocardia xishanensis TaxID=630995 RepID=A0ABP8RUH2_9PSEU